MRNPGEFHGGHEEHRHEEHRHEERRHEERRHEQQRHEHRHEHHHHHHHYHHGSHGHHVGHQTGHHMGHHHMVQPVNFYPVGHDEATAITYDIINLEDSIVFEIRLALIRIKTIKFRYQYKRNCIILGVELIDHVIIGDCRFISLKEKGYL